MNAFDVIKTVRLTEKGTRQAESFNQYTIVADRRAGKPAILIPNPFYDAYSAGAAAADCDHDIDTDKPSRKG